MSSRKAEGLPVPSVAPPKVTLPKPNMSVRLEIEKEIESAHQSDITSVCYQPGTTHTLASAGGDKVVRVWDLPTTKSTTLQGHTYYVNCVKFSPFGTLLASCSTDGKLILWNTKTGSKVSTLQHSSCGGLRVCDFSPNSTLLVTGGDDETLVIWNVADKKPIRQLEGHEAAITGLCFVSDNYVLSGSTSGELRLWDARYVDGKSVLAMAEAHDLGVMGCAYSPLSPPSHSTSHHYVATCGNDNMVKTWAIDSAGASIRLVYQLAGHSGHVMSIHFNNDGSLLASGGGDHSICIWNPNTGELLSKVSEHSRYVTSVAFTSDSKYLASGSNDRKIIIWKLSSSISTPGHTREHASSHNSKLVGEWSVGDVCSWLTSLSLDQYVEIFQHHQIDGVELLNMTHNTLINQLHINVLGHRNKMFRSLDQLKQNPYGGEADEDIPGEFLCPITHDVMTDPVIADDGYSYERSAIEAWIISCKGRLSSPMTNEPLHSPHLTPNRMLRGLIQKHLASVK